jgi:hypothetical protein
MGGINSNVVFLLHGDGSDQASVFIDSISGNKGTIGGLVANLITASGIATKFGTAAIRISGRQSSPIYISYPFSSNYDLPSDLTIDFRLEYSVLPNVVSTLGLVIPFACFGSATDRWNVQKIIWSGNSCDIRLAWGASDYVQASIGIVSIGLSYHIAITRSSNVIRIFKNGVSFPVAYVGTASAATPCITRASTVAVVRMFDRGDSTNTAWLCGSVDELRVVKGVAVWTENFTPPIEPYTWDIPTSTITISESSETKAELTYDPDYTVYPTHEISAIDNPSVIYLTGNALEGKSTTYSCIGAEGSLVMFATALSGELRVGSILASLPAITALVECGGDVNVNLPAISAELYGTVIKEASINTTLSAITAGLSGSQARIGYINKNLPSLLCAMSGTIPKVATINVNVPRISANIIGNSHKGLSMDLILPRLTATLTGYRSLSGSIISSLPSIGSDLVSESGLYETVVVNMSNKAMSKFINYNFNSLMEFNGEYLGIGRDGIYSLTGADDVGTDIQIDVKTAMIDLESETPYRTDMLQRMRHAWLGYKSNGDLAITVITDDGVEYEYTVDNITTNYGGRKVKFGKGLKDRYIQLELKNVGSATIQLDELRLFTEPVSHRKR